MRLSNSLSRRLLLTVLAIGTLGFAVVARADDASRAAADSALPPWTESNDVPIPSWARSVTPNKPDALVFLEPGKVESRRGAVQIGTRLPLFATVRAGNCQGRWMNIGPLAWICSDIAEFTGDDPSAPPLARMGPGDGFRVNRQGARPLPAIDPGPTGDDGLPYRYYFAGRDGASGFVNLANALDDAPDQDLEQGFAVAIVEEQTAHGERWGKTKKGRWIAMKELIAARPSVFHGELVTGETIAFGWVSADKANVYSSEKLDKVVATRARFDRIAIREVRANKGGELVRVSDEPPQWMRARDVSRPQVSAPPDEVGGRATVERWIDVDLAQQALVAYEGTKPVFATLVSTGRGAQGSEAATPLGVNRLWVKIFTTKMDNLEKEDADEHYALDDVPWVQFFNKGVGLHGAFWHRDFGRVHSHGCVNLAPLDARWLFAFTGPHLPAGWTAVYPTRLEPGTAIRVR